MRRDAPECAADVRHDAVVKALRTLNKLKSHVAWGGESWLCAIAVGASGARGYACFAAWGVSKVQASGGGLFAGRA